jgi:VanZ family protein
LRRFTVFQLPIILYAALIFTFSSFSRLPTPDFGIDYVDKLAHFIEYFIFLLLAIRAFSNLPVAMGKAWIYILAVFLSIAFAAGDEYHQSFVPGRNADIYDLVSDSSGIILGAMLHFLFHKRQQKAS